MYKMPGTPLAEKGIQFINILIWTGPEAALNNRGRLVNLIQEHYFKGVSPWLILSSQEESSKHNHSALCS